MGGLPFRSHPVLIFSYQINAVFHSFRTHCSNLPATIVVDHGGYFGGTTDILLCGKSTDIRSTTDEYCWRLESDLVTPLISGNWPGSSTLWFPSQYSHLLEYEVQGLRRFIPIGYTTVSCSQIECEHQLAARTMINLSCRHVWEEWRTLNNENCPKQSAL